MRERQKDEIKIKAYPGAATLGHPIPLLSFAADLTLGAVPSR